MNIEQVNSVLNRAIVAIQADEIEAMSEAMAGSYSVPSPSQMGFGGAQQPKDVKPAKVSGAPKPKTEDDFRAEHERALEYLSKHATKLKGEKWWIPPHNMMINQAVRNVNLWTFNYRMDVSHEGGRRGGAVNGIVVAPKWSPVQLKKTLGRMLPSGTHVIDVELVKKLISVAKEQSGIQQDVGEKLDRLEREHGIKIPAVVRKRLMGDALKVAKRRMGASGRPPVKLHLFDGSKPQKTTQTIRYM